MGYYYGIDVAKWNGTIDWNKVKASGKTFAICKITNKSNQQEESFFGNALGATFAGIPIGGYKYVYAKNVTQAKTEAKALVSALKGVTMPYGVWLDMEDASIRGIGKANLTKVINAEAEILRAAGYKVGIYCNLDWYRNVLDTKNLPYVFWIARYPSNDDGTVKESLSPLGLNKVGAWQYSSKGKVPGVSGNVDLNCSTVDLKDVMKVFG